MVGFVVGEVIDIWLEAEVGGGAIVEVGPPTATAAEVRSGDAVGVGGGMNSVAGTGATVGFVAGAGINIWLDAAVCGGVVVEVSPPVAITVEGGTIDDAGAGLMVGDGVGGKIGVGTSGETDFVIVATATAGTGAGVGTGVGTAALTGRSTYTGEPVVPGIAGEKRRKDCPI